MSDATHTYQAADGPITFLFAMAVEPEYGPELSARIKPVMTGVGPVEAATSIAHTLAELSSTGMRPDLVLSLGSCGSRKFAQGEIVQVGSVSYRDMDASLLGFEKGSTPFLDHPPVIPIPQRLPDLPAAHLSTGGHIISGDAYDEIDADIVDMESFAVLRAANRAGVAMMGLRGVSDGADDLAHYNDWADYLDAVDRNLAAIVDRLPDAISQQDQDYWRQLGWAPA